MNEQRKVGNYFTDVPETVPVMINSKWLAS